LFEWFWFSFDIFESFSFVWLPDQWGALPMVPPKLEFQVFVGRSLRVHMMISELKRPL
jgi:hypothetical protein